MYAQHRSIIFSRQQVFFVVLVQCTVVTLVLKTILRIGESANTGGKKYLSLLEVEFEQSLFALCGITHFLIASTWWPLPLICCRNRWLLLKVHQWATILKFLPTIWFVQYYVGFSQRLCFSLVAWRLGSRSHPTVAFIGFSLVLLDNALWYMKPLGDIPLEW